MARPQTAAPASNEFVGTVVFGSGLVAAAALNFLFSSLMGRMLTPPAFGTLGVLIAALIALIGPVNALSGGTEMFAALHDRFPRGRTRLIAPAAGVLVWAGTMLSHSPTVRSAGWFSLGAAFLILLAWNRGALVGLGRFTFVGVTFAVEGASRVALPVLLVAIGFGLEGASAGLVLGMLVALIVTEAAVPHVAAETRQPLGHDVWMSLLGLFALGLTQIVDVFAIRLANIEASGAYVGAASLARAALFSQMPAAAYALRRSALEGPRRALGRVGLLAVVPGTLAIAALELFPRTLLRLAYGTRFQGSEGIVRVLALAMLAGGLATVAAQILMGHRSMMWVRSIVPVAMVGTVVIVAMAHAPSSVALSSLVIQGSALIVVAIQVWSKLRAGRSIGGRGAVLILNWRDTHHPQGGGSEVYVEQIARRLVRDGRAATIFCAAYDGSRRDEVVDGVRFVRRGSWRTVYVWAFLYHLIGRLGPHDVVIDVKNGVPFLAPLYCRRSVICLVHHVHREQWAMNFSPRQVRVGWWIESRLSVGVYRRCRYVTVSDASKRDLVELGVRGDSIEVIHNGGEGLGIEPVAKAPTPTVAFLGRLVPHKRVELLLDAVADLRQELPGLRALVIGHGPWHAKLVHHASIRGAGEAVTFTGWVDDAAKYRHLAEAWLLVLPSVKEGWGLAVMEAASVGTPSVAFRVGGLEESVLDGETGLLVDSPEGLRRAIRRLVCDPHLRERLGANATRRAAAFSWDLTAARFQAVMAGTRGRSVVTDALEAPRALEP